MKQYKEEGLIFDFNNEWLLPDFKKDNKFVMFDKHPVYDAIQKIGNYKEQDKKGNWVSIRGVKNVDFVGVLNNEIHFIEVKNFRQEDDVLNMTIEHKATDIASKIKDSIATIVGGKFNCKEDTILWQKIVELLKENENKIKIICWLELSTPNISEKKAKDMLRRYREKLTRKLAWLIKSEGLLVTDKNNFYANSFNKIYNFEVYFETVDS